MWFSGGPGAGEAVGRKVSRGRAHVKRGDGPRHSLEWRRLMLNDQMGRVSLRRKQRWTCSGSRRKARRAGKSPRRVMPSFEGV